jgi:hypothetical protein
VVARKFVPEGRELTIGPNEQPVAVRLKVKKALYGSLATDKTADVTGKVDSMINDNVLSFTITDRLFGDPAHGQIKQLRVDYTFDSAPRSKTGKQNESFTISPANP